MKSKSYKKKQVGLATLLGRLEGKLVQDGYKARRYWHGNDLRLQSRRERELMFGDHF